jgi:Kef-type K+ transport system membrane component KefB
MSRLDKIQRISGLLRYLLIAGATIIGGVITIAMFNTEQNWVSLGEGDLNALWYSDASSHPWVIAIVVPIATMLVLGVYWLQVLLGEYQAGRFFADSTMRCYVWLVWLKVASFGYSAMWPRLVENMKHVDNIASATSDELTATVVDVGSLIELVILVLIVHVLKEAQKVHEENQAFI